MTCTDNIVSDKYCLWNASRRGDLDSVRMLLDTNTSDIENSGKDGMTSLLTAVMSGFDDVAELLMDHGADMYATTATGCTILHLACSAHRVYGRGGRSILVRILKSIVHEKRLDINAQTYDGKTALHMSVCTGTTNSLRQLLIFNADPSVTDFDRKTPFHYATLRGDIEASRLLLRYTANSRLDLQDIDGNTVMHNAAGFRMHATNHHFLQSVPCCVEIVSMLIEAGATVSLENLVGLTPLDIATTCNEHATMYIIQTEFNRRTLLDEFKKSIRL